MQGDTHLRFVNLDGEDSKAQEYLYYTVFPTGREADEGKDIKSGKPPEDLTIFIDKAPFLIQNPMK
jgi:hypothetical protein